MNHFNNNLVIWNRAVYKQKENLSETYFKTNNLQVKTKVFDMSWFLFCLVQ